MNLGLVSGSLLQGCTGRRELGWAGIAMAAAGSASTLATIPVLTNANIEGSSLIKRMGSWHCTVDEHPTSHVLQTKLWCRDCNHSPWVQSVTSDIGFPSSFCAGPVHLSVVLSTVGIMPLAPKKCDYRPCCQPEASPSPLCPHIRLKETPLSPYLCMKQGEAAAGPGQQQEALSSSARGCFQAASSVL